MARISLCEFVEKRGRQREPSHYAFKEAVSLLAFPSRGGLSIFRNSPRMRGTQITRSPAREENYLNPSNDEKTRERGPFHLDLVIKVSLIHDPC